MLKEIWLSKDFSGRAFHTLQSVECDDCPLASTNAVAHLPRAGEPYSLVDSCRIGAAIAADGLRARIALAVTPAHGESIVAGLGVTRVTDGAPGGSVRAVPSWHRHDGGSSRTGPLVTICLPRRHRVHKPGVPISHSLHAPAAHRDISLPAKAGPHFVATPCRHSNFCSSLAPPPWQTRGAPFHSVPRRSLLGDATAIGIRAHAGTVGGDMIVCAGWVPHFAKCGISPRAGCNAVWDFARLSSGRSTNRRAERRKLERKRKVLAGQGLSTC